MIRKTPLALKLALAFVIVALAGVSVVAAYVWRATVNEFGTFIVAHNRDDIVQQWAEFYAERNGWQGIETVLPKAAPPPGQNEPRVPAEWIVRSRVAVVDAKGIVVLAGQGFRVGDEVARQVVRQGVPIVVNGQEVGRLLLGYAPTESFSPTDRFLQRFDKALLWGGGAAALLAILLGMVFASSLTHPLRELRSAAEAVSRGEQVEPIPVRSHDELGQLAETFNLMTAELSRSQYLRRQMTADIAHELRTPLSLILGHAEAIEDGVLAADHETIGIIYDEALRLSRLVDDLRTLSLSDAGELSLVAASVSPVALLESAAAAHRVAAHEAGVTVSIAAADDLILVEVDPDRIAQVLHNLISNALRYTAAGGRIELTASLHEAGVLFAVSDNGQGIPADELPSVFERFYRGDRARQRDEGGSGLGLTIARSLVERHGGRIWAESTPGQGATFAFTLPAAPLG